MDSPIEDIIVDVNNEALHGPPPAPRKAHIRKMIKVSARVRRRINFEFLDTPTRDQHHSTEKKRKGHSKNSNGKSPYTFRPIFVPSNETPIGYPLIKCKPIRHRKNEENRDSNIDMTIQTSRNDEMKNAESCPCDPLEKTLRTIC